MRRVVGDNIRSDNVRSVSNNDLSQNNAKWNSDLTQEASSVGQSFLPALVTVLAGLASSPNGPQRETRFHSIRVPSLSLHQYVARIAKYFQCSNNCFVVCIVYISRVLRLNPDFKICKLNIHRLLLTSIMMAVKFVDDVYYSNAYYARVGGVPTKEMNALEAEFLHLIQWRLHVCPGELDLYQHQVYKAHNLASETKESQERVIFNNMGVDEKVVNEVKCD